MRSWMMPIALAGALAACGGEPETGTEAEGADPFAGNMVEIPAGETVVPVPVENGAGTPGNTVDIAATDAWVGRWTGVEGLYLDISKDESRGPGAYTLTMQYTLDDEGTFPGTATEEGIAFTRPDGDHVLRATDGEATGLKYLFGKEDCLTVQPGEGYCRD